MVGFLKLMRSQDTDDLLKKPNEFLLLANIALRARRSDSNIAGLKKGQAMMGDFANMGFKRQPYRTALANLQSMGFLTTQSTNKGTVATLMKSTVFDINTDEANHQTNHQLTSQQPSTNHQLTTNKKERKKEVIDIPLDHPMQIAVSEKLTLVPKMQRQLEHKECEKLLKDYHRVLVWDVLQSMDNYKPLLKNTSVYLTARNWCGRRLSDGWTPPKKNKSKLNEYGQLKATEW